MWNKPSQAHVGRVLEGLATADERTRVLKADRVNPNKYLTLLEELRNAGEFLPQCKDGIVDMEAWEPWTGISEARWLDTKERRGRRYVRG